MRNSEKVLDSSLEVTSDCLKMQRMFRIICSIRTMFIETVEMRGVYPKPKLLTKKAARKGKTKRA
jgi:hypothetical protein